MKESKRVSGAAQNVVNSLFFILINTDDDRIDENFRNKCKDMISFLSQKFQTLRLPESLSG